jgi:hypothetical protein
MQAHATEQTMFKDCRRALVPTNISFWSEPTGNVFTGTMAPVTITGTDISSTCHTVSHVKPSLLDACYMCSEGSYDQPKETDCKLILVYRGSQQLYKV